MEEAKELERRSRVISISGRPFSPALAGAPSTAVDQDPYAQSEGIGGDKSVTTTREVLLNLYVSINRQLQLWGIQQEKLRRPLPEYTRMLTMLVSVVRQVIKDDWAQLTREIAARKGKVDNVDKVSVEQVNSTPATPVGLARSPMAETSAGEPGTTDNSHKGRLCEVANIASKSAS